MELQPKLQLASIFDAVRVRWLWQGTTVAYAVEMFERTSAASRQSTHVQEILTSPGLRD
ncbi:hypothetical protein [Nonomuraea sp. NPDC049028]|uniref:hypothetical protein n=1 Tax=Nonomuraea sp. NPDC049028 TaxID=3364348 RepID=UPI0037214281